MYATVLLGHINPTWLTPSNINPLAGDVVIQVIKTSISKFLALSIGLSVTLGVKGSFSPEVAKDDESSREDYNRFAWAQTLGTGHQKCCYAGMRGPYVGDTKTVISHHKMHLISQQ